MKVKPTQLKEETQEKHK